MLLERANLCEAKTGMTGWVKEFEGDCMGTEGTQETSKQEGYKRGSGLFFCSMYLVQYGSRIKVDSCLRTTQ